MSHSEQYMIDFAQQLAELGYPVFPLIPGRKKPLPGSKGLLDATLDAEQIEAWWSEYPRANIGVRTDGLLLIDVDGVEGMGWLIENPDYAAELTVAPISVTANGGRHYWFRQPEGASYRNTAGVIAPKIDTRANGGYVVAPPSELAGDRGYRWVEGFGLECGPEGLPEPPKWLVGLLEVRSPELRVVPQGKIPEGKRNAALASIAGVLRRQGCEEATIRAALRQENTNRCNPPMRESEVDKIAWSVSRYPPDDVAVAIIEDHYGQFVEPEKFSDDPGEFPASALDAGGLIGMVADYTNSVSFRRQPVLALAGAISLASVLTGHLVTDTRNTRTNLYIVGTADSGAGKDMARTVNKNILTAAGLEDLIGPEGIASHAGLVTIAANHRKSLLQLDEIGRFLNTLSNASKSPHLYNIVSVLMKLYSSAHTSFIGDGYADAKLNKVINQPHVTIYGTTVPDSLYGGFSKENLSDGLLSRLLIFEGDKLPESRKVEHKPVPEAAIKAVAAWKAIADAQGNLTRENPNPRVVHYDNDASERMDGYADDCDNQYRQSDSDAKSLWTRAVEKGRKLALIHACSLDPVTESVGIESVEWAISVVDYLTRRLIYLAEMRVASNEVESNVKRVYRIIAEAGDDGLSSSKLTRKTQFLRRRDREEIVLELVSAGMIRRSELAGKTNKTVVYKTA